MNFENETAITNDEQGVWSLVDEILRGLSSFFSFYFARWEWVTPDH